MITFTVPKPLPNFTRWEVDDWEPYEKRGYGKVTVIMRSAGPTSYTITKEFFIRNTGVGSGKTDQIGYLATVGGAIVDQLSVSIEALSLPTAFTDAQAAYQAGGSGRQAKLDALAVWLLSSGVANSSMAGA